MTAGPAYALFDTAIGRCGIAWSEHGIVALNLPEPTDEATRARLRRKGGTHETVPPPRVISVIDDIVALMRGEPRDLT
jgi:methylated-DNA-[protein]-cysteine S-methyltransferase